MYDNVAVDGPVTIPVSDHVHLLLGQGDLPLVSAHVLQSRSLEIEASRESDQVSDRKIKKDQS